MAAGETPAAAPRPSLWTDMRTHEDWWAIWCAATLLAVSFLAVWISRPADLAEQVAAQESIEISNPFKPWLSKPGGWSDNPTAAFYKPATEQAGAVDRLSGTLGVFAVIAVLFAVAVRLRGGAATAFLLAFPVVFLLATLAYVMSTQEVVNAYNLEYALWALLLGLIISNTLGTPQFVRPAVMTEFYIKTGLVLLGAEVLMNRLLALGVPGIFVAWVVTPIVLISTYIFGQKVLKLPSRSLNMVISADMSVCGVSAAIATAAACKAKKEELSLAIGMSLTFTVLMMVILPAVIKAVGMSEILGGAWLGGTIDSTGAVAAAGAVLGDRALEVAATVKMIQNILIGVTAFGVAIYWVTYVERDSSGERPGLMEIWYRFPKFVLGFVAASVLFSTLQGTLLAGPELIDAMIGGSTKTLRGWFFCLAFVSIGLETNFRELLPYLRGGKPLILYVCGQSLNLVLTLFMAWLMFEVIFRDLVTQMLP
ncbi:MAG: putative sulfate exporter family transporter [Planctomycetales bacterium]|nr:putative sulfate exporter family transporter [Planctomycetales bacterium]